MPVSNKNVDHESSERDAQFSLLSCVSFVPRAAMQQIPGRYEPSTDELQLLAARTQAATLDDSTDPVFGEDGDGSDVEMETTEAPQVATEDMTKEEKTALFMQQLNMDTYDEEEEGATMMLGGMNLTVYANNSQDPYITVGDDGDESEEEDLIITASDTVFLAGRTSDDHSVVEVYVYDEAEGSLYVHHDFAIPALPLALQWMTQPGVDAKADKKGSFAAVATMGPAIELWNLDVMDVMEPAMVLGGVDTKVNSSKKKKNKKKNKKQYRKGSHTDAVLCLDWHSAVPQRLASGSADHSIKLWDVNTGKCVNTMTHHADKVQSIKFNPAEPSVLLSGGYDRMIMMKDVRGPSSVTAKYTLNSDIECLIWNPVQPFQFFASTEDGMVYSYDARAPTKGPLFQLAAHSKACSDVTFDASIPNMIATASLDGTIKLWDITNYQPKLLVNKDMKLGPLMCMHQQGYELICGGNKGTVGLWDIRSSFNNSQQNNN